MKKIILFFIVSLMTITAGATLAAANEVAPTCADGQVNCMPIIYLIKNNITIDVPGNSPFGFAEHKYLYTIQDALEELNDKKIAHDIVVTIKLTQNPTSKYGTIVVDHPDGDKIHIKGDCNGNNCNLQFEEKANGLQVSDGNKLGLIDGFCFIGTADSQDNQFYGIYANNSGVIKTGESMVVHNFYNGVFADNHSYILANKIKSTNNVHDGIIASNNSAITFTEAAVNNNGFRGCEAAYASNIDGSKVQAESNGERGVAAVHSSSIKLYNAQIDNNKDDGIYSAYSSSIDLLKHIVSKNNNGHCGLRAWYNAIILCHNHPDSSCPNTKKCNSDGGLVIG
jgi:hypothetical protein